MKKGTEFKMDFCPEKDFFWKAMYINFLNFLAPFYGWGSTVSRLDELFTPRENSYENPLINLLSFIYVYPKNQASYQSINEVLIV